MRANISVKAIDRASAQPIPGVKVMLGTTMYSLEQTTDPYGGASFTIDVGGDEAGRHPEEGIAVSITANKTGYYQYRDRFPCYGNKATIAQMERTKNG